MLLRVSNERGVWGTVASWTVTSKRDRQRHTHTRVRTRCAEHCEQTNKQPSERTRERAGEQPSRQQHPTPLLYGRVQGTAREQTGWEADGGKRGGHTCAVLREDMRG